MGPTKTGSDNKTNNALIKIDKSNKRSLLKDSHSVLI